MNDEQLEQIAEALVHIAQDPKNILAQSTLNAVSAVLEKSTTENRARVLVLVIREIDAAIMD